MYTLADHENHKSIVADYEGMVMDKMNSQRKLDEISKDLVTIYSDIDNHTRKCREHMINQRPDEAAKTMEELELLIGTRGFLEKLKMQTRKDIDLLSSCLEKAESSIRRIKKWIVNVQKNGAKPDV